MQLGKQEVVVTICCAIFVAITSVVSALIARQHITHYDLKIIPRFELVTVTDYFPLRAGNEWTYEGTSDQAVGGGVIAEKKVKVRMRVVKAISKKDASLFVMEGHPTDVIWALADEDKEHRIIDIKPSRYGYLVISNKVFEVDGSKLNEVAYAIETSNGLIPEGTVSGEDIAFEFPLFEGQRYGETHQLARDDLSYFWYVNNSTLFQGTKNNKIEEFPKYQIVQNTRPGYVSIEFIPYLGITHFSYSHHGTKAQSDVSLTDYNIHIQAH